MSYCEIPGDNVVKIRTNLWWGGGWIDGVFVCQLRFTEGKTVIDSPSRIGRNPLIFKEYFK